MFAASCVTNNVGKFNHKSVWFLLSKPEASVQSFLKDPTDLAKASKV